MEHFPSPDEAVERGVLTRAQLAHTLGVAELTLGRKMAELRAAGFPDKLPGLNKWSRLAVLDWLAHSGGGYVPFAERELVADGVDAAALALEKRYAA